MAELPDVGCLIGLWVQHEHLAALCSQHQAADCIILCVTETASQHAHTCNDAGAAREIASWRQLRQPATCHALTFFRAPVSLCMAQLMSGLMMQRHLQQEVHYCGSHAKHRFQI